MKLASVVTIFFVGVAVSAQSGMRTFTSPDGIFRFRYPASHQLFTDTKAAQLQVVAYLSPCSEDSSVSAIFVIACVFYPQEKYKDSNFQAAALQVGELRDKTSMAACSTPQIPEATFPDVARPEFEVPSTDRIRLINGLTFVHGVTGGAGLGHELNTDLYRAFHNGKCYELDINITWTGSVPPGKREFTKKDSQRVFRDLQKVLDSFTFLQ